jgi:hypothetical protein
MEHNCVRNPGTGACYVCGTPIRQNFGVLTGLDAVVDATQHPQPAPTTPRHECSCGAPIKPSETQCLDCWIAEQTKQPAPQPVKQIKRTAKITAVTLDSILDAMTDDQTKWN